MPAYSTLEELFSFSFPGFSQGIQSPSGCHPLFLSLASAFGKKLEGRIYTIVEHLQFLWSTLFSKYGLSLSLSPELVPVLYTFSLVYDI